MVSTQPCKTIPSNTNQNIIRTKNLRANKSYEVPLSRNFFLVAQSDLENVDICKEANQKHGLGLEAKTR